MNIRKVMVAVLALACGLSAMILVQALRKPQTGPVVERVPVVIAAADIQTGESILASMLEIRQYPKEEVPEDAIHEIAVAIDRAAQTQLDKGDIVREKKLAERGAGRGMAALVKTGMRAFTIQTPSFSSSLAGFLRPHDKVDVLMTTNSSGGPGDDTGGATTTTLLQNVEILAVHTNVNAPTGNKIDPDQSRSVTLQVTPEQAAELDLGQSKGTLHLSLRNLKDDGIINPLPTTLANILPARPMPKAVHAVAPPPAQPEVVNPPPFDKKKIKPGMRAFTIETPLNSSSLVGLIDKDDWVDVLVTTDAEDKQGTTSTLLTHQEVLHTSVLQAPSVNSMDIKAVTLQVTPKDAQLLDLAQKKGTLHLSLRGPGDANIAKPPPVMLAEIHMEPLRVVDQIQPGKRAFTIETPMKSTSLLGLLRQGDHVDVLVTTDDEDNPATTSTLLINQEVLSSFISQPTSGSAEEVNAVTLQVKPRDAQLLDLAQKMGMLHISLRSPRDGETEKPSPVILADIHADIEKEGAASLPTIRTVAVTVRTLRGTVAGKDVVRFDLPVIPPPTIKPIQKRFPAPNFSRRNPNREAGTEVVSDGREPSPLP